MIGIVDQKISDVKLIRRKVFSDERGFFSETYRKFLYEEEGIAVDFVQDNHSCSVKGTIRGMHFQGSPGQAKLITVVVGKIYDVFVDIREDSPTFGQWGSCILDASESEQLFIPIGFAHGFAALSDVSHVLYKVSSVFDPNEEKTFRYDDPEVGISWPFENPILSERDQNASSLKEILQ